MKFVHGSPAAVVGGWLVVAEVHLGIEFLLQESGARVFPDPSKLAQEIRGIMRTARAKKIIFLGDLKQDVRGFENRERRMLDQFISELGAQEAVLVKGNHDAGVEGVPGLRVEPPAGVVVKDGNSAIGLAHGHAWPSKEVLGCKTLLLGHTHPVVEFVDANKHRTVEKIWLVGQTRVEDANAIAQAKEHGLRPGQKVVVFPAFSRWAGGLPVNATFPARGLRHDGSLGSSGRHETLIGPIFSSGLFDLDNAVCYSLDGVELGTVASLRPKGRVKRQ